MRRFPFLLLLALTALVGPRGAGAAEPPRSDSRGAFAFSFTAIEGEPLPLERWAGRPLLVVNTASMCGFTYQYEQLQALWQRFRERGLVVVGVPSNDFNQERGSASEIKTFCETNFAVDFPMTEKVAVRGDGSHPLFAWLREELGERAGPRWNFHKYLIAPDGRAVQAWGSGTEPTDPEITAAVQALLPAS